MDARAWFYATSFHSNLPAEKPAPAPKPTHQTVERWDGEKWITVMVPLPPAPEKG
jgi:hypothetical protein